MEVKKLRRIGILTSGGDAPGMNAAIRAVVRNCQQHGIIPVGIRRGFNGLIHADTEEMDARSVNGITARGGTILFTARSEEFKTEAGLDSAAKTCRYLGIDGIVGIGGDGTDTAKLAGFETVYASVAAYVHNLNTYGAYADFRKQRAQLRSDGKAPDGQTLAITLQRYSELGLEYTRHIQGVIEKESLRPFDDSQLMAERDSEG